MLETWMSLSYPSAPRAVSVCRVMREKCKKSKYYPVTAIYQPGETKRAEVLTGCLTGIVGRRVLIIRLYFTKDVPSNETTCGKRRQL